MLKRTPQYKRQKTLQNTRFARFLPFILRGPSELLFRILLRKNILQKRRRPFSRVSADGAFFEFDH
jgi:hypothetical protein